MALCDLLGVGKNEELERQESRYEYDKKDEDGGRKRKRTEGEELRGSERGAERG